MKFYEYIFNSFKVTERTQFCQETATKKFKGMYLKKYQYKSYGSCALHVI